MRGDALSRTLIDAEGSACLLMESCLEHVDAAARAIGANRPLLPHSVGRTAFEHALRALHMLDDRASDLERATRRLNEWLYAVSEAKRLRADLIAYGHPGAEGSDDHSGVEARIRERAEGLGLTLSSGAEVRILGTKRASTMELAERYLAGDGGDGLPKTHSRWYASVDHGVETGLLRACEVVQTSSGVGIARAVAMPPAQLAYELQSVPMAMVNGMQLLGRQWCWSDEDAAAGVVKAANRMWDVWHAAIGSFLDDFAPGRERTGLMSMREMTGRLA